MFSADKTSAHALASSAIMKNFQPGNDVFLNKNPRSYELSNFYSLFPVENEELVYGKWEDKIIWDDQVRRNNLRLIARITSSVQASFML